MRDFLCGFFREQDFPEEAQEVLIASYDKIMANPESAERFEALIAIYSENNIFTNAEMLDGAKEAGEAVGVHEYTSQFLLYICLTRHLLELYLENGYSRELWHDTMTDFRTKLIECHTVHGIWGSFVLFWFREYYLLARFALGRLQFEKMPLVAISEPTELCGVQLKPMDPVLSIHIPATGRLYHEDVIASYKKAWEFFSDRQIDGKLVICCYSWLINEGMYEYLTPGSNVMRFSGDFNMVKFDRFDNYVDCWRLFDVDYSGNPDDLPGDTTMRRQVKQWLKEGGVPGRGHGILVFDGEKVLK